MTHFLPLGYHQTLFHQFSSNLQESPRFSLAYFNLCQVWAKRERDEVVTLICLVVSRSFKCVLSIMVPRNPHISKCYSYSSPSCVLVLAAHRSSSMSLLNFGCGFSGLTSCGLFSYFAIHYSPWDPYGQRPLKAPVKQELDSQGPRLTQHHADEL